ncbi:hypothetical protein NL676_010227 [Syzygium grande]|nr:hypothetical protein NL676_010227 [Syzygium grande]
MQPSFYTNSGFISSVLPAQQRNEIDRNATETVGQRRGGAVNAEGRPPRRRPGFADDSQEFVADGASGGAVVGMMIGPDR